MAAVGPVYFTDENALGLGKLLRRSGRTDVLYPGHDELPEVPLERSTSTGCQSSPTKSRRGDA
jgi:hypothetical protein